MSSMGAAIQKFNQAISRARKRWQQMEEALDQECGRKHDYTVAEAAAFWDVHEKTVRRWIHEGRIYWTNHGIRKTRIARQEMLAKQWERDGEAKFFAKIFLMVAEGR
jgi:excisionase family DNA binding protein